tara:strand:- start:42052 stop:42777 length:726 start_codon:yes stop_codon:yes gene_type:complete
MKSFLELPNFKKKKSAIFLGCGPSIENFTADQWKFIKDNFDVWASNNWIVNKDIIPDFYHLEVKMHRSGQLMVDMLNLKHESYKDVCWILDNTRPYLLQFIDPRYFENIFLYDKVYRNGDSGAYEIDKKKVSVSCNASLTVILDIMQRMEYESISFAGVDMTSSKYFWTDNPKYEEYPIPDIMKSCKPDERPPDSLHPTFKLKDFIPEFCEFNGIESYNLSPESLLKERMKTCKLEEIPNV